MRYYIDMAFKCIYANWMDSTHSENRIVFTSFTMNDRFLKQFYQHLLLWQRIQNEKLLIHFLSIYSQVSVSVALKWFSEITQLLCCWRCIRIKFHTGIRLKIRFSTITVFDQLKSLLWQKWCTSSILEVSNKSIYWATVCRYGCATKSEKWNRFREWECVERAHMNVCHAMPSGVCIYRISGCFYSTIKKRLAE